MTCPNRDGTIATGGCIFCSGSGSGDFAVPLCSSVTEQINTGIRGLSARKYVGTKFIAYFQSYTNTYAPTSKLRQLYMEALQHPQVVMLSIATRPDCLPEDVLDLLEECNRIKPVILELGLQTIHDSTATYIRRGYATEVYDEAVRQLVSRGIEVVTHVIAGLPGESEDDFLATVSHVANSGSTGIKIQLLHILKGTDLAIHYSEGRFHALSQDGYISLVLKALSILPPDMVIHRLTGDGPKDLLIAPMWSCRKRHVLNEIHRRMKEENIWQGKEKKE